MFRTQAAALTVLNLLYCALPISAAPPSAGDNAEGYAALCPLVNLASSTYAAPAETVNNDDIVSLAAAINLTLSGEETVNEAIKEKDKEFGALPPTSKLKNACSDKTWAFCQKGAVKAEELKTNNEYQQWKTLKRSKDQALAIANAVDLIKQISESTQASNSGDVATEVNKKLTQALTGGLPSDGKVIIHTSNVDRATSCGNPTTAKGKLAGENLAYDMMCLCASETSHTGHTACTTISPSAPSIHSEQDTDVKNDWLKYKADCEANFHSPELTSAAIRAAVANFVATISKGQGTDSKLHNVLGKITGGGNSGCTGQGDNNNGRCVYYGKAPATRGSNAIPWAAALLEAADTIEEAKAKADQTKMIRNQLLHLNITLKRIAFASTFQQPPTHQNIDSKEAECNKIGNSTDCAATPKCKWDAEAKDPKKRCTLSEEAKKAVEKAAEKPAGGAAEPGVNCSSHTTKETCEAVTGTPPTGKAKVCGWIEDKCKDSSILVNKQFALSVVSAAFAALLF